MASKNNLHNVIGNIEDVAFEPLVMQVKDGLEFIGNEGGHGAIPAKVNSTIMDTQEGLQVPTIKKAEDAQPEKGPDESKPAEGADEVPTL